jgi:hypothetical protein
MILTKFSMGVASLIELNVNDFDQVFNGRRFPDRAERQ